MPLWRIRDINGHLGPKKASTFIIWKCRLNDLVILCGQRKAKLFLVGTMIMIIDTGLSTEG